jgi:cytochrome c peroxidase
MGFGAVANAATVAVNLVHTYDGAPLALGSFSYKLRTGESISISRLSYLLSGFALERKEGGWVELTNQFAWLDAEKQRVGFSLKEIPAGEFRAMRFAVGLDPEVNKSNPASYAAEHPLNPNLNGLHWSWQGGYIFLALEGYFRAGEKEPLGWSYHFARDPNRTIVTLPCELRLATGDAANVEVAFDIAALLNAPRPISPARDGSSTHSREGDPIAAALRANLPGAFQLCKVQGGVCAANEVARAALYLPTKVTPYPFRMSGRFPIPPLPHDNPLLAERVELGRKLFQDTRLSRNGTIACATCHDAEHAFSDPRRFSLGVEGQAGTRQAMPLFNLAWKTSFFWDGRAPSLRAQALVPIQDHTEMDESLTNLVAKLSCAREYGPLFTSAFGSPEITAEKIGLALENFLLTLTSYDSKFDRAMRGDLELNDEEKRGFELFFTEFEPRMGQHGADCFHCHGGALFSDHQFHNNGLDLSGEGDPGRFKISGVEADRGKFSTPSLRNVALTAPYMHDGRFKTLEEVVKHYSSGVKRSATLDPNLAKHPEIGLQLSEEDQRALVAFLKSLTDEKLGEDFAKAFK